MKNKLSIAVKSISLLFVFALGIISIIGSGGGGGGGTTTTTTTTLPQASTTTTTTSTTTTTTLPTFDNSTLNGTYRFFRFDGFDLDPADGYQYQFTRTNYGDVEYDGNGNATITMIGNSSGPLPAPSNVTYSVDADGTITIAGVVTGIVSPDGAITTTTNIDGTLPGNAFTIAVKKSTGKSNADFNGEYRWHALIDGQVIPGTAGYRVTQYGDFASSGDGNFSITPLADSENNPGPPEDVTVDIAPDGTFDLGGGFVGIISPDNNYIIVIDIDASDNELFYLVSIKKSSGKTNSDFSGVFQANGVRDNKVTTGGLMSFVKGEVSHASNGDFTYTTLANSYNIPVDPISDFKTTSDDGIFSTNSGFDGILSPDNNIYIATDTNNAGDNVWFQIYVRKTQ